MNSHNAYVNEEDWVIYLCTTYSLLNGKVAITRFNK